jgi:nucleoside-diphosphate-sugar epimerase
MGLMKLIARTVESAFTISGKEPPFSSRSLKFFTDSAAFDISKAREVIKFEPAVGLDEGLRVTNEWFTQKGLL